MAGTAAFDTMDSASAALILQILETDSEDLLTSSKGKGKEEEISDRDFAIDLFLEEVRQKGAMVADRAMSRSITRAVISDSDMLTNFAAQEQAAAQDRATAINISDNNGARTSPQPVTHDSLAIDECLVARLRELYVLPVSSQSESSERISSYDDGKDDCVGPSSGWAAANQTTVAPSPCVACESSKLLHESFRAPCGHFYCQECLERLFGLATTDESIFPPRCCRQRISVDSAKLYLSRGTIDLFLKKSLEFEKPHRSYCFRPSCSTFIPPSFLEGDKGVCPKCGASTCTTCKGESHLNDCPQDTATQTVLELANQEGWQRCFACKRLVELSTGCNHISCRCGAEFCYQCGMKWKNCPCPQWQEHHILGRARQIADRPERIVPLGQIRERRLAEAVEDLRQGHACQHQQWECVRGEHQCEECFDHLNRHIYECTQCHIRVCNRCRRNRL